MAKHFVTIEAPKFSLGKADIEFKAKSGLSTVGTLKVSKGGVTWAPKRAKAGGKKERHLGWKQFARMIETPSQGSKGSRKIRKGRRSRKG